MLDEFFHKQLDWRVHACCTHIECFCQSSRLKREKDIEVKTRQKGACAHVNRMAETLFNILLCTALARAAVQKKSEHGTIPLCLEQRRNFNKDAAQLSLFSLAAPPNLHCLHAGVPCSQSSSRIRKDCSSRSRRLLALADRVRPSCMISCMIKGGHAIRTGLSRMCKAAKLHPLLAVPTIGFVFDH